MDRMEQGRACSRWDIHPATVVQVTIVEGPILEGRAREQGGSVHEVGNSAEDKGIGGGG